MFVNNRCNRGAEGSFADAPGPVFRRDFHVNSVPLRHPAGTVPFVFGIARHRVRHFGVHVPRLASGWGALSLARGNVNSDCLDVSDFHFCLLFLGRGTACAGIIFFSQTIL